MLFLHFECWLQISGNIHLFHHFSKEDNEQDTHLPITAKCTLLWCGNPFLFPQRVQWLRLSITRATGGNVVIATWTIGVMYWKKLCSCSPFLIREVSPGDQLWYTGMLDPEPTGPQIQDQDSNSIDTHWHKRNYKYSGQ